MSKKDKSLVATSSMVYQSFFLVVVEVPVLCLSRVYTSEKNHLFVSPYIYIYTCGLTILQLTCAQILTSANILKTIWGWVS